MKIYAPGGNEGPQELGPDGSAAAPGYSFATRADTGIAKGVKFTDSLDFYWHGVWMASMGSGACLYANREVVISSAYALSWSGGTDPTAVPADISLMRDAAGVLAQRDGVNAQEQRLYRTYTDASNYERLAQRWNAGVGSFDLVAEAAGTGAVQDLALRVGAGKAVYIDPTLSIGASGDVLLQRGAANTLALRNGVNAQAFWIANTYTDASNYERLAISWAANLCTITPQALGTGTLRGLQLGATSTSIGFLGATPVVRQTGASAAGIAAVIDPAAKAALTALQAALTALGLITSPA